MLATANPTMKYVTVAYLEVHKCPKYVIVEL